jgi:hypothetical protein
MSTLGHVSVATRVLVAVVASALLLRWFAVPEGCGHTHEPYYELIALGSLVVGFVPLVVRAVRYARHQPSEGSALPDIGIVVGVVAILLLMHSGRGRPVVYDGCWSAPDMGGGPAL